MWRSGAPQRRGARGAPMVLFLLFLYFAFLHYVLFKLGRVMGRASAA